jgi:hypothetical protein
MLTAKIAVSASGINQIVAGAAGFRYRVIAWVLSFSGSVNAKWQTGSSSPTDLTGLFYGAAGVIATSPTVPVPKHMATPTPQFETNAGDDLTLNLSGSVAVGGYVVYEPLRIGSSS